MSWRCPTCERQVDTQFCAHCGESVLRKSDLSLRALATEAFHTLTDIDSRMLRSFRYLLFRPGALTAAYVQGSRKPYFGPIQLFLITNLLFFTVQSLSSRKIFSTPLASHLQQQDWSAAASAMTAAHLAQRNLGMEAFAPVFDHAVATNAKSLVVLMAIPFALLLPLLFVRSGRAFATHIVFALHFYSFQLLLFCAALLVSMGAGWLGAPLGTGTLDTGLFVILLGVATLYLFPAVGLVYGQRGVARVLKVLALVLLFGIAIQAYRFVLFAITLYTN